MIRVIPPMLSIMFRTSNGSVLPAIALPMSVVSSYRLTSLLNYRQDTHLLSRPSMRAAVSTKITPNFSKVGSSSKPKSIRDCACSSLKKSLRTSLPSSSVITWSACTGLVLLSQLLASCFNSSSMWSLKASHSWFRNNHIYGISSGSKCLLYVVLPRTPLR